jgi:hypothetical protein
MDVKRSTRKETHKRIHAMDKRKKKEKPYVWVTDPSGNEYLCPADALKKPEDASAEELKSCIDAAPWKPYLND